MANTFRPKKKVRCPNCGWEGTRARASRKCPQCQFWHPKPIDATEDDLLDACRKSYKDICNAKDNTVKEWGEVLDILDAAISKTTGT